MRGVDFNISALGARAKRSALSSVGDASCRPGYPLRDGHQHHTKVPPSQIVFTPAAASTPAGGKRRIPSEYLDGDDEAVSEHLVALEERLASLITDSITPRLLPETGVRPPGFSRSDGRVSRRPAFATIASAGPWQWPPETRRQMPTGADFHRGAGRYARRRPRFGNRIWVPSRAKLWHSRSSTVCTP